MAPCHGTAMCGAGIGPGPRRVAALWRQAARGGDVKSQYLLGVQFFNGEFVTRDYVQAYAWLSLASRAGIREAAEALATTRTYLEAPAIEEATRLADTLVTPPAQAAAAPVIRTRAESDAAQLDGAVLRHPVDDLVTADLSPISPDAVQGALPIPLRDETQPAASTAPPPVPAPAQAPAKAADPTATDPKAADPRDAEYRAQFASFPT